MILVRGRFPEERRAARQERSCPIVAELEPWLRAKLALISKKSKLAEAIRYALARWEGICRFLDDGRIEIESNTVERSTTQRRDVASASPGLSALADGLLLVPALRRVAQFERPNVILVALDRVQ